jgi:hypothetical protein
MNSRTVSRVVAVGVGLLVLGASAPAMASVDKSVSSSNLKSLSKAVGNLKHLTYEATYKSVADGVNTTVTIAQAPPKSSFSSGAGSVVSDGSKTYYCSAVGGSQQCLAATGPSPVASVEAAFSPSVVIKAFTSAELDLNHHADGIKVTETSAKFAGLPATCITVTAQGQSSKYCVTKSGLLAYAGATKGVYFELTKFTKSPPASLFTVTSGATTVTLPGGSTVTLPGGESIP